MGDAMHRQEMHLKYPVVAVDQIEPATRDLPVCKIGKADLPQKPWKDEHRDLMENNGCLSLTPLVCEQMDFKAAAHG